MDEKTDAGSEVTCSTSASNLLHTWQHCLGASLSGITSIKVNIPTALGVYEYFSIGAIQIKFKYIMQDPYS